MDPIVLIGFMGSGKTTLGRRLAEALGVDFIDCDTELEAAAGCSIRTLMERHGESVFRAPSCRCCVASSTHAAPTA